MLSTYAANSTFAAVLSIAVSARALCRRSYSGEPHSPRLIGGTALIHAQLDPQERLSAFGQLADLSDLTPQLESEVSGFVGHERG